MNINNDATELAKAVLRTGSDERAIDLVANSAVGLKTDGANYATMEAFYIQFLQEVDTMIAALEISADFDPKASSQLGKMRVAKVQANEMLPAIRQAADDERKS